MVESKLQTLVERLEKAVERAEANAAGGGGGAPAQAAGPIPKVAREYAKAMEPKIAAVREATAQLGNAYITAAENDFLTCVHL